MSEPFIAVSSCITFPVIFKLTCKPIQPSNQKKKKKKQHVELRKQTNCQPPVSHSTFTIALYYIPLSCCFFGLLPHRLLLCWSSLFDAERGSSYKGLVLILLHNTADLEWQEVSGREMLSSCLTLWLRASIVLMGQVHMSGWSSQIVTRYRSSMSFRKTNLLLSLLSEANHRRTDRCVI